jgi:GH25 family lysozyme M1 (1,4-beta-N-acetylmuramidase)
MIYDNQSWVTTIGAEKWGYMIALADISHPITPSLPCALHQYSWSGAISGITGAVDLDAWCGSLAEYKKFFGV